MRSWSTVAVVFIVALFAVGCSQGPSQSLASGVAGPTSTQVAPPAYDASGNWNNHFVISLLSTGQVLFTGDGVQSFTQDADGNLVSHDEEEGGTTTLTRNGNGKGQKINYVVHHTEPSSSGCGEDLSGTAQLDTVTNTINATLIGVLEGCGNTNQVVLTITGTKQ